MELIPSTLNSDGAYIIGALLGDKSSVSKSYNIKHKSWAYYVDITIGGDYDFGKQWLECCSRIQGKAIGFIYKPKGRNWWIACARYKKIYTYITQFIDGKWRSKTWRVPKVVYNSNSTIIASFLCGLYDAEASVGKYYIVLAINNESAIKEIQNLLAKIGIKSYLVFPKTRQIQHLLITREHNLKLFRDLVGFKIQRKKQKLIDMIKNIKFWRVEGRSQQVLNIAETFPNEFKSIDIAKILKIRTSLVSDALKRLKRMGKVEFKGNGARWGKWVIICRDTINKY